MNGGSVTPKPKVSAPLRQHRVQLAEAGGQHLLLGRGDAVPGQAAQVRAERRVVLVDQDVGAARQPGQVAEQVVVAAGEVTDLLAEEGRGHLVVADGAGHAEPRHDGPLHVVRPDADDDDLGVRGLFRLDQLRRRDLPVAEHLDAEQAVLDGRAAAGQVQHVPVVHRGQVRGVGLIAAAAGAVQGGRVGGDRVAHGGRGGVADHDRLHAGQRVVDRLRGRRERIGADQVVEGLDAAQHPGRARRGQQDAADVHRADDDEARDDGLGHLFMRLPAHAGHRDQPDGGEAGRDERLPLEVARPALRQLLAEVQLERARAVGAQQLRDLGVDGDVGELEQRPDRALELRLGRHHLAEQVKLARARQAERAKGRDGRTDLGGLAGCRHRLQRRDLQREPDRARGDDEESDEVEGGGPGQSQECGNVALPWGSWPRPSTLPRDRRKSQGAAHRACLRSR